MTRGEYHLAIKTRGWDFVSSVGQRTERRVFVTVAFQLDQYLQATGEKWVGVFKRN